MQQTPIQRRIELSVTGGLGYDSQTDFSKIYSIYSDGITPEEVKNTETGLEIHLREMTKPEIELCGTPIGHLFSYDGRRMEVSTINNFTYALMVNNNQKIIDRAYNTEAKKLGRIKTINKGIRRNIFADEWCRSK